MRRIGDRTGAGCHRTICRRRTVRLLRRTGFCGEAGVLHYAAIVALATLWFFFAAMRIAAASDQRR